MKATVRGVCVAATLIGMALPSMGVAASPLRSPHHGQEAPNVTAGIPGPHRGTMRVLFRDDLKPLFIQGGNLEVIQACHESANTQRYGIAPGKMGRRHLSNAHVRMRAQLRACIAQTLTGD